MQVSLLTGSAPVAAGNSRTFTTAIEHLDSAIARPVSLDTEVAIARDVELGVQALYVGLAELVHAKVPAGWSDAQRAAFTEAKRQLHVAGMIAQVSRGAMQIAFHSEPSYVDDTLIAEWRGDWQAAADAARDGAEWLRRLVA